MSFEEILAIAREFYKDKPLPKTTREYRQKGNSPPGLSDPQLRKRGITVALLLHTLDPSRPPPRKEKATPSVKEVDISHLGLGIGLKDNTGSVTFVCDCCGKERRSTITTLNKQIDKFCSVCRGVSGVPKDTEYYDSFLPKEYKAISVIREAANTKIVVKHLICGTETTYSSRHVLSRDTNGLACSVCSQKGGYDSLHEKEIIEFLESKGLLSGAKTQIKYSEIFNTDRRYIADLYFKDLNAVIEITTKGNGLPNYFDTLNDKLILLKQNNIKGFVAYSKQEAHDIVRSLLKDKEVEITNQP